MPRRRLPQEPPEAIDQGEREQEVGEVTVERSLEQAQHPRAERARRRRSPGAYRGAAVAVRASIRPRRRKRPHSARGRAAPGSARSGPCVHTYAERDENRHVHEVVGRDVEVAAQGVSSNFSRATSPSQPSIATVTRKSDVPEQLEPVRAAGYAPRGQQADAGAHDGDVVRAERACGRPDAG